MANLQANASITRGHGDLLRGAVRLAIALGVTYRDVHGHVLGSEREVLEALARDGSVTSSRAHASEDA